MVEQKPTENKNQTREELLQQAFERMFSLMKQIHRDILPPEPLLSPPQARLVFIIARYKEEGVSVKELARVANITPGAITQFMDQLIAKKLVKREEDPDDRRIIKLKLTPLARNQMDKFRKDFIGSMSRKFDVLSTDELKELVNVLTKVSPEPFPKDSLP